MLFRSIRMQNLFFRTGLDEDAVGADIPFITAEKMKELVEVWLPLLNSGSISLQTFLSKIPEVDAQEEMKLIEAAKQQDLARMKAEADIQNPADALNMPGGHQ